MSQGHIELASLLVIVAACQPSTSTPIDAAADSHVAADASHDATSEPPVDASQVACNTMTNPGTTIQPERVAQSVPAPTGGTIVDGTYVLTDYRQYTGAGGATGAYDSPTTIAIQIVQAVQDDITIDMVRTIAGQPDTRETYVFGWQPGSTTTLVLATTCGPDFGTVQMFGYDATPFTFAIHTPADEVITLARQ